MAGMHIVEGFFDNVPLAGLNWVATYHWPGALHEGNGSIQPFIDVSASAEQRAALLNILGGKAGGTYFEILASIITTVHEPQFVPIRFEFDKTARRAHVAVPGFMETTSEPLIVPATGDQQRVILQMPDGFEYKEMEVAQTGVLKGTGPIKFDHKHTHSSLAEVEHTHEGLLA
jgi:hypothetical protein